MRASQAAWKRSLKAGSNVYLSPAYVTNGHWLVRRSAMPPGLHAQFFHNAVAIQAFVGTSVDVIEKDDKFCELVLKHRGNTIEWIVTDVSVGDGRLLVPVDESDRRPGQLAAVAEEYVDLLGIETGQVVHGAVDSPFSDKVDDWTWVVMPRRFDNKELKTIAGLLS